jgi:folate-binding protein YgfZ
VRSEEYAAAIGELAVRDRSERSRLLVTGRAPVETLRGVFTGKMPSAPQTSHGDDVKGIVEYSAVLTVKGRMVADLRVMWGPDPEEESLLLDVPDVAVESLMEHLRRYLPPRLATVENVSESAGLLTVLGPESGPTVSRLVTDGHVDADALAGLEEGEFLVSGTGQDQIRIVRTCEVATPALDLFVSGDRSAELWGKLTDLGAEPVGVEAWDMLRVEAGRPAYGRDMDESTILSETGLEGRAVDSAKGCYTGQEVVVRIRDRGHVNRSLRGLFLADGPIPPSDAELFQGDRVVGHITSAVESPRHGGGIALAYVRREVALGERVPVGSPDGPRAEVRELGSGWALALT